MYSVVIIDDEPIGIEHIKILIEKFFDNFYILNSFDNSSEAINYILENKPDLVLTDIKMPIMTGIDIANIILKESPETIVIIISGFSDFSYAQEAIRAGVLDYLLKPINKKKLDITLNKAKSILEKKYNNKINNLIKEISTGNDIKTDPLEGYYYIALTRRGSLPRRFSFQKVEVFYSTNEGYYLFGRDEMESLYIISDKLINALEFNTFVNKRMYVEESNNIFKTLIINKNPIHCNELFKYIPNLYKMLDLNLTIGTTKKIFLDSTEDTIQCKVETITNTITSIDNINHNNWDSLELSFRAISKEWHKNNLTQLAIEREFISITNFINSYNKSNTYNDIFLDIEDAFYFSENMNDLTNGLLEILKKIYENNDNDELYTKIDTQSFINIVKKYVSDNFNTHLTLKIIGKEFGVSQSYLGKLFRKYEKTTFNTYLAKIRIEKAKKLIEINEDFMVKEIAIKVGYKDQFYFSRIFNSIVGVPPTEYLKMIKGKNNDKN